MAQIENVTPCDWYKNLTKKRKVNFWTLCLTSIK